MIIQWLGHASFLIISSNGTKIITDPYQSGSYDGKLRYKPIGVPPDVVTVSHDHADHSFVEGFENDYTLVAKPGNTTARGISIKGFETAHDPNGGTVRGRNIVFNMTIDGLRVCHLGDLGQMISPLQAEQIGEVDILMIPVGGNFTLGPEEADRVIDLLHPRIVLPMHYKTEALDFAIAPVDDFLKGKTNAHIYNSSKFEIMKGMLPDQREIIVLKHAL